MLLIPTLNCYFELNLMSYGQSNIILLIKNIFTHIFVILELICDILDLNLCKIQLQFIEIYFATIFDERHLCEENSSARGACSDHLEVVDQHVREALGKRYHV